MFKVVLECLRASAAGPTEFAAESFLRLTRELNRLDESLGRAVQEASDTFYKLNCVEEEPGKFRCPLSGKLFRDPVFVRKHIDNKHAADVLKARARPLGRKYLEYFLAIAALTPPPRPRPRPQQACCRPALAPPSPRPRPPAIAPP